MANYYGSLQAVDCHIHSVRYDMVLEYRWRPSHVSRLRWPHQVPTSLWRCRYVQQILEPCQKCFYTIMANYYESLEAVDCHIHSVRYDMALE
eukprot:scaffold12158_cov85-Skeletonema_dohrnii-CCMP3373.AAC.2